MFHGNGHANFSASLAQIFVAQEWPNHNASHGPVKHERQRRSFVGHHRLIQLQQSPACQELIQLNALIDKQLYEVTTILNERIVEHVV